MNDPDFTGLPPLSRTRLAVLGLGLMGGSLALALSGRCQEVLGVDRDPQTLARARRLGVFNRVSDDPGSILPHADLVVLAAPVRAILQLIEDLPDLHPAQAIVLDLGSTKAEIGQALASLPARLSPVGGHPMCGKETSGLAQAEATLYHGAAFALTALPNTTPQARAQAERLVLALGARPLWVDPATHDFWAAATSHVPYLLACALAASTPTESQPLIGPGFRSTARLAASSTDMMRDVLMTNRQPVLQAVRRFRSALEAAEAALSRGEEHTLGDWLQLAQSRHRHLTSYSGEEALP